MNAFKTIVFDLETKRLADEVGGWNHIDMMGLSAGVTYHVEEDHWSLFKEDDVGSLLDELASASKVVGYNVIRFDYTVLRPYGLAIDRPLVKKTSDLLSDISLTLGFRIGLDHVAEATLGESKSANGLAAVAWYKKGEIDKVLAYCKQDVLVTYRLWVYGRDHGQIFRRDRSGSKRKIPVSW
ncbi:MAG: ribonuclease H-like domain-containing protein [Anaerolineales bacterium]|nr:ribonuclease H-like domain-containing protein [Anaerolineales bacterium]